MSQFVVMRWGEVFLKGQNRPFFEGKLLGNTRRALRPIEGARVHKLHARMLVELPDEELDVRPGTPVRYFPYSSFGLR